MPGSTGPDLNTYTIPEVELGDTFNYWRDTTNTAIYKLNKLRVYDALDSASIGATYGNTGGWRAFIQETVPTGHTFTSYLRFTSGISTANLWVGSGATVGGNLTVNGGTTLASTLNVSGIARFASGVCAAGTLYVVGGATFAGNVFLGNETTGNALTRVYGQLQILKSTPLRLYDSTNTNYLSFQAPQIISSTKGWTLPNGDGSNGQVLGTDGSGNLFWKAADGVTGTDTQVQYNQGGAPGATSSFLFHYSTAAGYSAGTLGVCGGAYVLGNVGIGVTGQNIGARILPHGTGSSAARGKLEVAGDVRIPFGGFFVNKNIIVPAGVCGSIGGDENAFLSGTLTVASGATLTVETGGSLVIL